MECCRALLPVLCGPWLGWTLRLLHSWRQLWTGGCVWEEGGVLKMMHVGQECAAGLEVEG
jgi:hypothetical protein